MNKLLNIFIMVIIAFNLKLNAKDLDFKKLYFENGGGKETKELLEIFDNDKYYIKAVAALQNTLSPNKILKDVETNKPLNYNIKLPDWGNAYENFKLSVKKYDNPVSAYAGLYIINTLIGKSRALSDYKMFTISLYKHNKSNCQSFINYAEIYSEGILQKKNKMKAISVLEDSLKNVCSKGWEKQVVQSKLWALKR